MYIAMAVPSCFWFDRQELCRAFSRAWAKTGNRMAASIAIMAITTSSSISVNPVQDRGLLTRPETGDDGTTVYMMAAPPEACGQRPGILREAGWLAPRRSPGPSVSFRIGGLPLD